MAVQVAQHHRAERLTGGGRDGMTHTHLHCGCGKVRLDLTGAPMVSVECCCTSCRTAGTRMQGLPGAPVILTDYGATPFVLYRKDRVHIEGAEHLAGFRLNPKSHSRRVVATCCNTPMFLDFELGHWLSLYGSLWPADSRPAIEMRTMTQDLDDRSALPDDVPNPKRQNATFFLRLLGAWVAMGFRVPKVAVPRDLQV